MLQPEGEGAPAPRVLAIPTADLEILDTWHTGGLNGTGSHDAVADDVFVPEHRSLSLMEPPTARGALYRFPIFGFFALSIAAAALGNARGAIDDLQELAVGKVGQGSTRTLAQRPATWAAVGEAEAALRAARALYYLAVDEAWTAAQGADAADAADAAREPASDSDSDSDSGPGSVSDSDSVSVELRLGLRLAATHAARTAADVARAMYDLGGGAAIYETSPLQRRFRDAHTVTAHFQVNAASWELAGRVLLGQPTETGML
jgi:alkylation response protein AidB-like acyl-CoA dehydrogenase